MSRQPNTVRSNTTTAIAQKLQALTVIQQYVMSLIIKLESSNGIVEAALHRIRRGKIRTLFVLFKSKSRDQQCPDRGQLHLVSLQQSAVMAVGTMRGFGLATLTKGNIIKSNKTIVPLTILALGEC